MVKLHYRDYSKTCVKQPLSNRPKIGFQDQLLLNAGQKYCRMLQGEHSPILLTFIKQPSVFNIFVLSIFEVLLYTNIVCLFDLILYVTVNNFSAMSGQVFLG